MKLRSAVLGFLVTSCVWAQPDWDAVEITSEKITDNVYVLFGAGGNIGLALGQEYAYVIDDQFAQLTDKILAAVRGITDKPVRFVVNTHWHGDHVGGNENLAGQGALIIAHENVRKRMGMRTDRGDGRIAEPASFAARQKITFSDQLTIHLDSISSMHLMHVDPAHTDGDSYIYFPEENIIHMGDNFIDGYPYIDLQSGGDVDGFVRNLNRVLFIIDDQTRIIPGHGAVSGREQLVAFRNMIQDIRALVKRAKDSGNTLEQTQQLKLTAPWDEQYFKGFIEPDRLVEAIYSSVD